MPVCFASLYIYISMLICYTHHYDLPPNYTSSNPILLPCSCCGAEYLWCINYWTCLVLYSWNARGLICTSKGWEIWWPSRCWCTIRPHPNINRTSSPRLLKYDAWMIWCDEYGDRENVNDNYVIHVLVLLPILFFPFQLGREHRHVVLWVWWGCAAKDGVQFTPFQTS